MKLVLNCKYQCGKSHEYVSEKRYNKSKINGYTCPVCVSKYINYEVRNKKLKEWRDNGGIEVLRKNGILSTGLSLNEYEQYIKDKEIVKLENQEKRRIEHKRLFKQKRMIRQQMKEEYLRRERLKIFTDSNEIWKRIPSYPRYEASTNGRVRNKNSLKILERTYIKSNGYEPIGLIDNKGKQRTLSVHRIIAETFIPNPMNKPMVNHINSIRNDNRVCNLEWATGSENCQHSWISKKNRERSPLRNS